jgi:hypothetical protein
MTAENDIGEGHPRNPTLACGRFSLVSPVNTGKAKVNLGQESACAEWSYKVREIASKKAEN